jgi:hypothetical protein
VATSTTRKSFRQSVLKRLYRGRYPVASTTTGGGTSTTVVDSGLTAGAVDNDYLRAWIYIVEAGTADYGDISRVTNQVSGTLTVSPAFAGGATDSGQDYEIHYIFHPNEINDTLDEVLQSVEYGIMVPLALNSNPSFEHATMTTGWTATNATLAAETTIVRFGRQVAKLTLTADAGYIQSDTVNLPPGSSVYCATQVFCTSGDAAVLRLINIDDSNATIESGRTDQTGWSEVAFNAALPSGCERVAIRLEGVTNTDVVYFDHGVILPYGTKEFSFPADAEWSFDLSKVFYFPRGTGIAPATTSEFVYRVGETKPKLWSHFEVLRDETAINPYRVYLDQPVGLNTLWTFVDIDYPAFAGASVSDKDADTTKAPMDLCIPLAVAMLFDELAEKMEMSGEVIRAQVYQARADRIRVREISPMTRKFSEFRTQIVGALK